MGYSGLRTRRLLSVIIAIAVIGTGTVFAQTVQISLPEQPLSQSLKDLARQSGSNILFTPGSVKGIRAPEVHGDLTVADAVAKLLAATDLEAAPDGNGGLVIRRKSTETRKTDLTPPSASELTEIVVTGTHIHGIAPSSSPVSVFDRADINQTGAATVDQFMRTIPQNFGSVAPATLVSVPGVAAENTSRGSGVDLRGLGPGSTLILLNGHRLAPSGFDGSFVDTSLIPLSAIERVEMLTDGASALYGADAVGGVVNFILRKDFEGAETSVRGGTASGGGDSELTASQLLGKTWQTGDALFVFEHDHEAGLDARDRNFIPDQGGPYQLIPSGHRDSGLASFNQALSDQMGLNGNALYSRRTFLQETTIPGVGNEIDQGFAKQASAVIGLDARLPHDWKAETNAEYSRQNDEDIALFVGTAPANIVTQSQLESLDAEADGPVWKGSGGLVRASVGTSFRRERFVNSSDQGIGTGLPLSRNNFSAYTEIFAPAFSAENARYLVERLELSLAARFDSYSGAGANIQSVSSTTPKVGVLWSPTAGLDFRSTIGRSFRVAPLSQLDTRSNTATLLSLPNGQSALGSTNTFLLSGGNGDLSPETANVFTIGLDYKPSMLPVSLESTYFHVRYKNRIANPPLVGSVFSLYSQLAALAPYLSSAPTPAQIAAVESQYRIVDYSTPGSGGATAIFDDRFQNIATVTVSGVDATIKYKMTTNLGNLSPFFNGTYLRELRNQASPTTEAVDLVNTTFNPTSVRLRSGLIWAYWDLTSSATFNYVGSYTNNLNVPSSRVASWSTVDLYLAYVPQWAWVSTSSRRLTLSLSVLNVGDRNPPAVTGLNSATNIGFDPTNATPVGRVISAQVVQKW